MEAADLSRSVVFAVNGERFEVPKIHPSTTLLEFLRSFTRFKSVKLACGEGGCGSCIVLVSKYDPERDQVEDYTVNSCLTLVCSVNGCSITTSEGLGNTKEGFHPIHERFTGFHASQCGFCTPGMSMSLFSALTNADKTRKLTVSEAEKSIAGNLCRCTGYRPIVDACKSFASDVDIEDLGLNSFWKKEDSKEVKESKLPCYSSSKDQMIRFPEFLKEELKSCTMPLSSRGCSWYSPTSIKELQDLLESNELDEEKKTQVKLVVSNTGVSYYKELEKYDRYIDLKYIPELSVIQIDESGMHIGAAVTISKAIESLKEVCNNLCNEGTGLLLRKIANHLEKVATKSVRNSASVGGNLVMSQRNGFPSDIATLMLASNAIIDVISGPKREVISFEEFLGRTPLESRGLLVSVHVPSWQPLSPSKLVFETYRAAPRPLGNTLPYLNAAFLAEVSPANVINSIHLAFGAYGGPHGVRARDIEEFLKGKTLKYDVLHEAVKLVQASIAPKDGIRHASYRSSLATSFLFEFLHPLMVDSPNELSRYAELPSYSNGVDQANDRSPSPILLPAKQVIGSSEEFHPVGESLVKTGATLQASGEAVYVDDIPSPPNCLYGAFIYSTMPLARIKNVKFKSGSFPDGLTDIISFKDIPNGGENVGCIIPLFKEPLFAEDLTNCVGDRIAVVIAETQKQADLAANLAVVEYDTEGLDPPILTVEEAVEKSSFFQVPPFLNPKQVGDFSKGMDEADHKILSAKMTLPSQYYFYMETQTAFAVPDEDNCMVVYSSTQNPEYCNSTIARCLGLPEHNFRVITKRVGGGFGGKAMKSVPTTTACALAAYKLNRPVRMYLNRKTDMIMAGGRHPMKITYSVGFKSDGRITGLHIDVLIHAGYAETFSSYMPLCIVNALKKYNWGALSFDMKVCKTNHTSKSAMRGPGELQGSFIAEVVVEHVAASLSMDVDEVRAKNLHSFESLRFFFNKAAGEAHEYTLPSIWDKVAKSSDFDERSRIVREFNKSHEWKKRGVSRLPVVMEVSVRASPGRVSILWDGSIVVEIGGIELGQGLWTKVKQMAAFSLSLIKCDGTQDLVDRVRVVQADTLSLVQGGMTAGSTTSEASCEAVRLSCSILVERLKPLKEKLQETTDSVDWNTLIYQAELQSVNLSASTYYVPEFTSNQYLNYGAAVSEVEVNLLTGETTILRSDIVYDCGQSLNPAVDLGQIEGCFVQGIGFFMTEEYLSDSNGLVVADSTWTYKIPTIDTIPRQLNVEIINSGHHQKRVLSSKASGEPPLLLSSTVHCATRAAIKEARRQVRSWGVEFPDEFFQLSVPATMPVVKELCGLDCVEKSVVFAVNGERFEVPKIHPSTTLLEFLRSFTRFKSVKLACGEGSCGSCIVLVSKYDPVRDQVEDCTVNSCLTLLCNVNGCSITTSEGLGNTKDGFHPIHERFAGFHASQCGFCTPGMSMSLFSALANTDKTHKLTVSEAEKSIAENLCRCTGYRPIADACKSFASDLDIEDLGLNSFWKKEDSKEVKESKLPSYSYNDQMCRFPEFLKEELKSCTTPLSSRGCSWYSPMSIKELQDLLDLNELDEEKTKVKLVVSNTGVSYYKELEKYDRYIDLKYIPKLSMIQIDESGMHIGAAVTISKAIESFKEVSNNLSNEVTGLLLRKIANHLEKVATKSVRNSASLGGNLVMSQRNGFPSDIATLMLASNAIIDVISGPKREVISLEEFLKRHPLDSKGLLVSVHIPSWKPVSPSKLLFETYRAAPRPLGNALPYLNAAFLAEVSPTNVINNIHLAFGAYGGAHGVRARAVEEFLKGKTLKYDVLHEAVKLIQASIVPEDGIRHPSYRSSLAASFLFEFLHNELSHVSLNGYVEVPSHSNGVEQTKDRSPSPMLLPAKQATGSSEEFYPVGESLVNSGATLQASGEAVYVDDIPSPPNCLYGAFVYSTMPLARIKDVKFKSGSFPDGMVDIISFKDIPNGGENVGSLTQLSKEPLFAEDLTSCVGDRIAVVVAKTQKQADLAANLAVVVYDTEGLDPPILTVEEAVEKSSFFQVPPFLNPKQVGDFSKGMDEADHKILSAKMNLPSQYHFYMETQTALAVPDEDNCMVVYSSTQNPEFCNTTIARCLGLPEHNVRVITKRVGGGFGGKGMKSIPTTTACALAAHKLNRPVRMYLNRKTDMIMAGGRHPMKITYSVGFKSDGRITGLHIDALIHSGYAAGFGPKMPLNMVNALKKYNWGALSFDMKLCKTNHTSKTAMRSPGELQGSFIAEVVVEHVAASLSMDVDEVRAKNLHSFESLSFFYNKAAGEAHEYTLPSIWDKIAKSSDFDERSQIVRKFNKSHEWKKRGVSRLPVVMEVSLRASPGRVSILWDGSIVVEIGGIELGQGLWTKVKQMAAFGLSLIKCNGTQDLVDRVRVVQADTLSLVQGGLTAGSTTSEASCEAVRISCSILVERLKPLKEKLQETTDSVDWNTLIYQAELQSVNLSASTYYVPELTSKQYLNYGAAVSEVEMNLLTGETTILRSDIVYDCGQSLNPAVDLGQVEGSFVQGIGFFMTEEYLSDSNGLVVADSTWTYHIPTIDTIPRQFNVEILNSGHHQKRVLSSKASGEPPLLLAATVHCATRAAIKEARRQVRSWGVKLSDESNEFFQLSVPATMPVVKELCGLDIVDKYIQHKMDCGTKEIKR
ncbi:hypothetical protein V2J09_017105 [Rumex salicifolius]